MGVKEKIAIAKSTNAYTEGMLDSEVKAVVQLAKISAQIERRRLDMGMTQKEFADYMGVTQGMISKWESREYNFTIKTLNEICEKLDLSLTINMESTCPTNDCVVMQWG